MSNKTTFPPILPKITELTLFSADYFGIGYVLVDTGSILLSNGQIWVEITNVLHVDNYMHKPLASDHIGYALVVDKVMYSDGVSWSILHTMFTYPSNTQPTAIEFGIGYAIFDNALHHSDGTSWSLITNLAPSYTALNRPIPTRLTFGNAIVDNVLEFCDGYDWIPYVNTGIYQTGTEPSASGNSGRYIIIDEVTYISDGSNWVVVNSIVISTVQLDPDLVSIANLTGSFGFLKKTAPNTWVLDTGNSTTVVDWSNILNHPTTTAGYGITDINSLSTISVVAGENLGSNRAVMISNSTAMYVDGINAAHANKIIGITTGSATLGQPVIVQFASELDGFFGLDIGAAVYIQGSGILSTTLPTVGFIQQVGIALTTTRILINIQPSITLG